MILNTKERKREGRKRGKRNEEKEEESRKSERMVHSFISTGEGSMT